MLQETYNIIVVIELTAIIILAVIILLVAMAAVDFMGEILQKLEEKKR